jgi:hypothetical protein
MRYRKVMLGLLPLLFLLDPFTRIELILVAVVVSSWRFSLKQAVWIGFIGGLVVDLRNFNLLGLSSLVMLGVVLMIYWLGASFDEDNWLAVGASSILAAFAWFMIYQEIFSWQLLLFHGIAAGLIWFIYQKLKETDGVYLRREG